MAPVFDYPASPESSRSESSSPAQGTAADDMEGLEATYQEGTLRAGEEVDYFAAQLDRYSTDLPGPPADQRAQIFKLVESYYAYTRKRADDLRQRQPRKRSSRSASWKTGASGMVAGMTDDGASSNFPENVRHAEEEAQTWDLLRRVLPLRYRGQTAAQLRHADDLSNRTRGQWWNDFLISDSVARERKIVLEWLQSSASHGPPIDEVVSDLQRNAERGDIVAHGWLHTRHKIKLQKRVNAYQGVLDPHDRAASQAHLASNTLVTQLDPDAVTRQARKLEPQDDSFESAIWLGCYEMLRRGCSMAEIRDWCAERTELWRAASIAPLPLSNPEDEEQPDFDPSSLVLWRRMCYAAARDGGTGRYDRAVYGLLAGDLESVEAVCKSWDDFLFANYNALLRTQFDSYLIKHGGDGAARAAQQFPSFNAVLHHSDPTTVGKRLVAKLETGDQTRKEALRPVKVLQGAIVANDLDRYLLHQGLALARHANRIQPSKLIPNLEIAGREDINDAKFFDLTDHNGLRLVAHVLIIISTLDRLAGFNRDRGAMQAQQHSQEHIIAAYISYLRLAGLEEMVPLYSSKLHGERVYETLSRNLIHIVDNEARINQLTIMKKLGIDLGEFVKTQPAIYLEDVEDDQAKCVAKDAFKILEDGPPTLKYGRIVKPDFFGEDPELVDPEDDLIIRSMEWLLMFPEYFVETCTYAIRIYKYFLKRARLRAARQFAERVSGQEIIRAKCPLAPVRPVTEELGPGWFDDFVNADLPLDFLEACRMSKDRLVGLVRRVWELECLVRALDSIETLSSLAGLSREETSTSREMWQHTGKEVRTAKDCMKPIFQTWLLGSNDEPEDDDFKALREAYLPETVLAYISCLQFVGTALSRDNLLECMELAAKIAEKDSNVAEEFKKCGRMQELVESFASCSKALAVWMSDKKPGSQAGSSSKKMRESGWSRELWVVKP
ncbi:hypothetical protein VTJ83DRAFT_2108 [Remersonia thermophila]|uniref:Nuclear pore complex protein n=1 Tax=Remersonia thermophila TaxID=72144 RepID=A0ABR4DK34_9PEZI